MSPSKRWPRGTGQWNRTRILIVAASPALRERLVEAWSQDHDVVVASSPLEVIRRVDAESPLISTVVLGDVVGSAIRSELAEFLTTAYPDVRVIIADADRPMPYAARAAEAQA